MASPATIAVQDTTVLFSIQRDLANASAPAWAHAERTAVRVTSFGRQRARSDSRKKRNASSKSPFPACPAIMVLHETGSFSGIWWKILAAGGSSPDLMCPTSRRFQEVEFLAGIRKKRASAAGTSPHRRQAVMAAFHATTFRWGIPSKTLRAASPWPHSAYKLTRVVAT
ncbi:unnamed protein product [Spirodela intermedia]|uniref:Uncharacterized protein n=1 Tax=Spirodela intermedia TaxID=51605 RepID=A0A7I8KB92_SPIIN|nr:unnamed protein product [Spirodela intermedia]